MEQRYNIHNLVKIIVQTNNIYLLEELDYTLRYFKTEDSFLSYDIEIKDISHFSLPQEHLIISDKFFGFKNGFFSKDDEYAIIMDGEKITLFEKENSIAINELIELLLLKKGYTFIHGAGISYNGDGVIFPSPPNTGKTTLMSKLRKKDSVNFFGDDYIILKEDGTMLSYPMDFSIHDYHFKFFEELKESSEGRQIKRIFYEKFLVDLVRHLPIRKKLKKIARFFNYEFLKGGEYLKVEAKRLMGAKKVGKMAKIKYSVCLNKYEGSDLRVESVDPETIIKEIIGTLQSEWYKSLPALHFLASFGLVDLTEFFKKTNDILRNNFKDVKFYRVLLPSLMEHQERFRQLDEFLETKIFRELKNGK